MITHEHNLIEKISNINVTITRNKFGTITSTITIYQSIKHTNTTKQMESQKIIINKTKNKKIITETNKHTTFSITKNHMLPKYT